MRTASVLTSFFALLSLAGIGSLIADPPPVPANVAEPAIGLYLPATCHNVVDGDTIDVTLQFKVRIRLENCWAPETHGVQKAAGLKAKVAMRELAEGRTGIVLIPWKENLKDMLTLDRVVGGFVVDGVDVAKEQVSKKRAGKTKEQMEQMFPTP